MKVFFIGTPRGNVELIRKIHQQIEEMGCEHTTDFTMRVDSGTFYDATEEDWRQRYLNRLKEIASSDVCIFEVSKHSLAVGQLVQEAINSEKPTILLYKEGKKPHFFRGTDLVEKRVQLIGYDESDIEEVLKDGLEIAEGLLTTRFTMLMPAELMSFLDKEKKKSGLSRSEYIRKLIKREKIKK